VTSQDHETLDAVRAWLAAGHRAWLVTVASTFGASPRPPGSLMAMRDDGLCIGSVSGGCIEDDLLARRFEFEGAKPALVTYGVLAEEAQRFGLPCGGTVTVLVEAGVPAANLGALCRALEARQVVRRTVDLASGAWQLAADDSDFAVTIAPETFTCAHGPRYRLLVIGGSEIAHHLCRIAVSLDYAVHICEPREELRRSWRLPDDVQWQAGMPDDVVQALRPDARTVIVTVSHDPKLDDMALMEALKSPAAWVGAVGSERTSQARRERLLTLDLTAQQVGRLHAPVGLPIGSRTPAEIAVAIAAELVAVRSGRRLSLAR
jgi:xanthine dehydrogenase accessory factor